ncbi:hypothetical protein FRC14_000155 [Serendipita sp. 396]|nr:hypothetical protein FRC14_000155 [Serendipita sp. 396]KAG8777559.1 hypothetical protein FRC15_011271 [Serendipita sp. 397]KAG8801230.1 hypothetical protein FRC16_001009 [Serendipita sp. 398]KAG8871174.1 hypothetical protein FRC20_010888 [Serendipita sp. 405]
MSRLASFSGPSTPSRTPVVSPDPQAGTTTTPKKSKKNAKAGASGKRTGSGALSSPNRNGPSSSIADEWMNQANTPSRASTGRIGGKTIVEDAGFDFMETAIHRKLRQTLLEIRSVARKWNELVKGDGFQVAKELIDTRTTIKYVWGTFTLGNVQLKKKVDRNSLALIPEGQTPRKPIVTPNMFIINEKMIFLEKMVENLQALIERLNTLCEALETLQIEALNDYYILFTSSSNATSSPSFDLTKPLYPTSTWSLSKFTTHIPRLLFPYYLLRLQTLKTMIDELRNPQIEWERARMVLAAWKDGRSLYNRPHQQQQRDYERENDSLLSSSSSPWEMVQIGGVLLEGGWSDELEEMCAAEIPNWK